MSAFITYVTDTTLDDDKFRVVTVVRMGKDDVQTPDEVSPYGIDSCPINDIAAAFTETTVKGDNIIIGYYIKNKKALAGENRLFSTDASGTEKTRIWLHNDGTIELGGTGDAGSNTKHAAQFEGLQTAFNQLKSDFDSFVSKFNGHTHVYSPGGGSPTPTAATTTPANNTTADISPAKLNNIKTE